MTRAPLRDHLVPLALAAAVLLCCAAAPTAGDSSTLVVTTDSSDYCRTLSSAIEAQQPLPREIVELKTQGDGMCDEGQVRGGIARLRRALLALHHQRSQDRR